MENYSREPNGLKCWTIKSYTINPLQMQMLAAVPTNQTTNLKPPT